MHHSNQYIIIDYMNQLEEQKKIMLKNQEVSKTFLTELS